MTRLLLACTFVVISTFVAVSLADTTGDTLLHRFEQFKAKYNRSYATPAEEERRFEFFKTNVKKAALQQRNDPHATYGITKFSDRDPSLKRPKVVSGKAASSGVEVPPVSRSELPGGIPVYVDWREKGAVVPPPNQGQCGDVCSFAITGVVSSVWKIAGHPLTPLSAQQLTSCVTANYGCNGCEPAADYEWILQDNHGNMATDASYPYNSSDGIVPPCITKGLVNGATITAWNRIAKNEDEVALWLATHGPVAISCDADPWEYYTGGVLTTCASQNGINHMALLIGYNDKDPKLPYWIIRNQWGTDWGEGGYIYIQKGVNCNDIITDSPSTVTPMK